MKHFIRYFLFFIAITNFAQSPGGVSNNCVFWVKADDLTLNTGDNVSLWSDLCGLGNDATQSNILNQPTYNEVAQNYNPGVYFFLDLDPFNSVFQYMNMDNLFAANSTTINIFAVGTNEVGSNDFHAMVLGQSDNEWTSGGYCLCNSPTGFGFWVDTHPDAAEGSFPIGGSNMPSSLLEGKYDGSEVNFYLDARNDATNPFTNPIGIGGLGAGTTHLGGDGTLADNHKGHISEVIIYSDALSNADRNKINSYLAIKYGIEGIDRFGVSENIIDSSGNSLFTDVGGDFWNGILGIGRDDTSALYQKQSHLHSDVTRMYLENLVPNNQANTGNFNNGEFIMMGNNDEIISPFTIIQHEEVPAPLFTRLEREWKITNTSFIDVFNIDIELNDCIDVSLIDVNNLRMLVDSDSNFSNATVYENGDSGLIIEIEDDYVKLLNISNAHIASDATQYITIASAVPILLDIFIAEEIDAIFGCDDDNDGFAEFTLDESVLIDQVIGSQNDLETIVDTVEFFDENGDALIYPYLTDSQTITVRATHVQGCYAESTFELIIVEMPVLDVLDSTPLIECSGYVLPEIIGVNLTGNQAYYTEQDGGGTIYLEDDILSFDDFTSYPVTLYIFDSISSPANCFTEQSFELTIEATPLIDAVLDVMICEEYTLPVIIGTYLSTNVAYYTDQDGIGIPIPVGHTFSFIDFLNYPVTIYLYDSMDTGNNFCATEESFELTIYNSLNFVLSDANLDIDFIGNLTVNMTDFSVNYEYAVDNQNFQATNTFSGIEEGIHTLYVRDENDCITDSIEFEMIIIYTNIPKFFTPNGDGANDNWVVVDNINSMKNIYIFDRFGKIIAKMPPNGSGWSGLYNGKPLFETDYWYKIELVDGGIINGHFSLTK